MPKPTTIEKAVQEIRKRRASYEYFFDHITSPDWIRPLLAEGMFKEPPPAKREGEYISFPVWPESRYLARMAPFAPELVADVALKIPETDNVRVHEDLADIALALPAHLTAKFVPRARVWLRSPYQLLLPEKLGSLMAHLAQGGQVDRALRLARALLAVERDPRAEEKAARNEAHPPLLQPQPRFAIWNYERILNNHVPDLVTAAGQLAIVLLCDLLEITVRLSRPDREEEALEDFSTIWRPAIEDHTQNPSHRDLDDLLVSAIRDATEQLATNDRATVSGLVTMLEERGKRWRIFQRLALHLLRRFPEAEPKLVTQHLTNYKLFDDPTLHHEYSLLLKERFPHLTDEDQETILGWIDKGPEPGRLPADEFALYKKAWRRRRLSLISDHLPDEWKRRYDELIAEFGPEDHPEFLTWSGGVWVGPTSPKTDEELRSMAVPDIVEFLKTWTWTGEPRASSPEGFGRQLAPLIASDPARFAVAADQFRALDPTYIRYFLSGLVDAVKENRQFEWAPVLNLCRWVVNQPREIEGRKTEYMQSDPSWGWARRTIAQLLSRGFERGSAEIPFPLRRAAWDVVLPLTDDPDPTPQHEAEYGGSNMDPATLSINTTRGEAMHTVVRYALWVRRHMEKAPDAEEQPARGFDEMPEVREVLDRHLDPSHDPAPSIRAVYGQWFPWLHLLDPAWAEQSVAKIFPEDESLQPLRDAAWETYVTFCAPYDATFDVLRQEYERAVERLDGASSEPPGLNNPEGRLAEHLMALYWRGKLDLEDPEGLLGPFYRKAPGALRGHALRFVGRSLRNTEEVVAPEILERLRVLWKSRIDAARTTGSGGAQAELAEFGWWFAAGKFDDSWSITQLKNVLELVGQVELDHLVVERLAQLAPAMPLRAVECLALIVEGDKEGWGIHGWQDDARSILSTATQSSDHMAQKAAVELINRLGARGHFDYKDLLPK